MLRPSRIVCPKSIAVLFACLVVIATLIPGAAEASADQGAISDPPPQDFSAEMILRSFPERRSSSYGARSFLSRVAATLQLGGWSTEILPYATVIKVESPEDKQVLLGVTGGENLLALEDLTATTLDYLLVAAYDNVFLDNAGALEENSFTALSSSMALDIAGLLDRTHDTSFGIAFVAGHYQYGAGVRSLLQSLETRGTSVRNCVVLGDIRESASIPLIASANATASLLESLMARAKEAGLSTYVASPWMLDLVAKAHELQKTSPESILGMTFGGEHEILAGLGVPVVTIGLPSATSTAKLGYGSATDQTLESKASLVAQTVSSVLNSGAGNTAGRVFGDMALARLFEGTYLVPQREYLIAGVGISVCLGLVALISIPKDLSSLALAGGTTAASAVALLLHHSFSNRDGVAYASALYPARALSLVPVFFALMVMAAFLRLWSIRSRIHHLHERAPAAVPATNGRPVKATWGSAWSLSILAALCLGASITRSEILPSLVIAGAAHGLGTLILRKRQANGRPSPLALWISRILFMVPVAAVFWAGSPLAAWAQTVYRGAWIGVNQGSLASALALSIVAASILSTFDFPKPASPKALVPLALCEVAILGLIITAGFFVPARSTPGVPTWAVFSESHGADTRISVAAPSPISQVELRGAPEGMPDVISSSSGVVNEKIGDRTEIAWASLSLNAPKPSLGEEQDPLWAADLDFAREPDILVLRMNELGTRMSSSTGFEMEQLLPLLGVGATDTLEDNAMVVPPGYTATLMWWKPTGLPSRLEFELRRQGITRVEGTLQAIYLDQSYLGISPATQGVRYYTLTSVSASAF